MNRDIHGLNPFDVQRIDRATTMVCAVFRGSDHGNARPHTTGEGIRCLNCDEPLWKHWLRQAVASAEHLAGGGVGPIEAERQRQISQEGWTAEHDDKHNHGELIAAAMCYLDAGELVYDLGNTPPPWPFEPESWKPSDDPIRNLIKAGALIAAEIERLQRKKWPTE